MLDISNYDLICATVLLSTQQSPHTLHHDLKKENQVRTSRNATKCVITPLARIVSGLEEMKQLARARLDMSFKRAQVSKWSERKRNCIISHK